MPAIPPITMGFGRVFASDSAHNMASSAEADADLPPWVAAPTTPYHTLEHYKDGQLLDATTLKERVTTVGRDASATLALLHPTVSRKHGALVHDGDRGLFLVGFESQYGSTVDGVRCAPGTPTRLRDGATVRFALSSRSYVARLAEGDDASTAEARLAGLPTAFSGGDALRVASQERASGAKRRAAGSDHDATKRSKPDASEARAALAERRAARQREIDAMAAAMTNSAPTYERWTGGDAEVADADAAPDAAPAPEVEEEDELSGDAVAGLLAKRWDLPVSHEVTLGGHTKSVSCIAVDPAGARVLTGSLDYKVRLFDFGGMDKHHHSFREIEPDEGHAVVALSYSPSGDRFLCCSGSAQPQIFTRDGAALLRFNRGDPYVTDMARTTGHVTIVTGGQWHPHEKMQCVTSGMDGSLRVWDLCGKTGLRDFLLCDHTIRVRDKGARKCAATAVAYSPDGRRVCCGAADGSLQIFQLKGRAHNYLRPDACLRLAHTPGTDVAGAVISCVSFSPDGNQVASRADDGFVKVFDVRKLAKGPLCAFPNVEARGLTANLAWRPDGAVLCAGAAAPDRAGRGSLRFFSVGGPAHEVHREAGGYRPLVSLGVGDVGASCVCVLWHDRIKHVLAGGTDGATRALYDPELSQKGALMSVRRNHAPRHVATDSAHVDASSIVNPNALPMFRDDGAFKKKGQYSKMRKDPIKSKLPDGPLDSGQQGRNEGARSTFCQYYIERNLPDSIRNSDPREELLKYADKEPIFRTEATFYTGADGQRTDMADSTLEAAEVDFVEDQKKLISHRSFSASAKDAAKKKKT